MKKFTVAELIMVLASAMLLISCIPALLNIGFFLTCVDDVFNNKSYDGLSPFLVAFDNQSVNFSFSDSEAPAGDLFMTILSTHTSNETADIYYDDVLIYDDFSIMTYNNSTVRHNHLMTSSYINTTNGIHNLSWETNASLVPTAIFILNTASTENGTYINYLSEAESCYKTGWNELFYLLFNLILLLFTAGALFMIYRKVMPDK